MSSKYVGTWKLESSENFDEYMKAVGKCYSYLLYVADDDQWVSRHFGPKTLRT